MFSAFNPSKCTHLEQWAADCAAAGEQSWTSCRSRDSNPQPWVTSGFKSNALSIRPTTAPNQVCDIAGNEVSPTKHARGDSSKEPKLHQTERRKKPWEKPGSVGGPVPLRPDEPVVCSNCSKVSVRAPLVPVVFSQWLSR